MFVKKAVKMSANLCLIYLIWQTFSMIFKLSIQSEYFMYMRVLERATRNIKASLSLSAASFIKKIHCETMFDKNHLQDSSKKAALNLV